jgi:6-phosphogluconate dehydrogenase
MQLGMIGLGRMGANMVRRLLKNGHQCVVYDRTPATVNQLVGDGATGSTNLDDFVKKLNKPRAVWLMVPAGVVDATLHELTSKLDVGDIVIDGGNSYYIDDIRRAKDLSAKGIHYVGAGTSGGVWGLERGYCQMIGETDIVKHLDRFSKHSRPGAAMKPLRAVKSAAPLERISTLRPIGRPFRKMVHNGIEYGLMAAYARAEYSEHANVGSSI